MPKERLHKFMAAAGVASRRKCETLIEEGRVRVNSHLVNSLPAFVDPDKDTVTVDGRRVRPAPKLYYLLNKPKGVVCTNRDPCGRKKAIDLVPSKQRLICVGRLDMDTQGLIILTSDTELANQLTHPRYQVPKTYVARVKGRVTGEHAEKLKKGVWLSEGHTGRAAVKIIKRGPNESAVEITIRQGLNRQVRRSLARIGLPVKSLKRTKIAHLTDKGLPPGRNRPLTKPEIQKLRDHAKQTPRTPKKKK
jgi:23S rRNA pseudouridine2605 synthase